MKNSNRFLYFLLTISILLCVFSSSEGLCRDSYSQWENGLSNNPDYFPIAVWLQNPRNAEKYKAIGVNLYIGLWQGPTEQQLKDLKQAGMRVICSQNAFGLANLNNPTIAAWMHQDEPDNAQPVVDSETGKKTYGPPVKPTKIFEDYKKLQKNDPTRPILLNLGQGVANDEWKGRGSWGKKEDYPGYARGCDILSFDVYPVAGIQKPDGENYLWYIAKGLKRLAVWSNQEKILWNCIECTHISNEKAKATPHQVKAEVWMSIIHGSKGIIYFVHEFKPKFKEAALLDDAIMREAVSQINHQIHSLAPVLNTPMVEELISVESSTQDAPIAIACKKYNNATYVFAVGMRNRETQGKFTVNIQGLNKKVTVLNENREILMKDSCFTDHFNPYDVHIYKID